MFFEAKKTLQIFDSDWEAIIDKRKDNEEIINIQERLILDAINDLLTNATPEDAFIRIAEIRGMKKSTYMSLYNNALKMQKIGVKIA